jgi:hypothetical protein
MMTENYKRKLAEPALGVVDTSDEACVVACDLIRALRDEQNALRAERDALNACDLIRALRDERNALREERYSLREKLYDLEEVHF